MRKKAYRKNTSTTTCVTSFRLFNEQAEALKRLPERISSSAVIRTLLQEYLDGNLPHINALIIAEAQRAEDAFQSTQF